MSAIRVTSRRQQRRSVRVRFRCDDCNMWGDNTTATDEQADALLQLVSDNHKCQRGEVTG